MKKILVIFVIGFLFFNGLAVVGVKNKSLYIEKDLLEKMVFSEPIISEADECITVNFEQSESFLYEAEKPILPFINRVFTFPFGSNIKSIDVYYSDTEELQLTKQIKKTPKQTVINDFLNNDIDENIYKPSELYPSTSYDYKIGTGLDGDRHVVYLALKCYPIRYSPFQKILYFSKNAEIKVSYEEPTDPMVFNDIYDLVIISSSEFSSELQPLINHKNKRGVNTILKTTEEIYNDYDAYDEAEEIKYFIKDAIKEWGVEYVLLVGDVKKLPIRSAWYFNNLHGFYWNHSVITDLYYADVYDKFGEFCSWDSNGNGLYGEVYRNCTGVNDTFDLYPDVNVGRLACTEGKEVETVVDKIIHYEIFTYGEGWFNNIILIGGDTFNGDNVYDGEEKNKLTEQIMSDFIPVRLWTSENNFTPQKINNAINKGAGFIDYAGHGVELGLATHPPNSSKWIRYTHLNLLGVLNGYKLPIVFLDACSTAKLDYTLAEYLGINLDSYSNEQLTNISTFDHLVLNLENYSNNTELIFDTLIDCFAWRWVEKKHGGSIATIGATRVARGDLTFGCNYLSLKFFEAYSESKTISQMMTKAQTTYLNIHPEDYFTVQEFVLLGDPSLKIGGFEETSRLKENYNHIKLQNKLLNRLFEIYPNAFPLMRLIIR